MKKLSYGRIPLKELTALALLCALSIVTGKFLAFNLGEVLRFSFENLPIIFAGCLYGPLGGLTVGVLADLIGCVLVGYAINPLVTLGAASIGLISGVFSLLLKRTKLHLALKIALTVIPAHLVGSVIIKTVGLAAYYSMDFYLLMLWRALNYLIIGTVEGIILYFLFKSKAINIALHSLLLSNSEKTNKTPGNTKEEAITKNDTAPQAEDTNEGEKQMTYKEALDYIHGISWTFCKPGLERISELCKKLGNPEKKLKFIHVAGTNGKGSFCSMLESVLRAAGYKTGLYTSPYILEFGERMRFLGKNIPEDELAEITEYVKPIADSMEDKPTEFELITAIAFEYFKRCGCDIVVLETGMGGLLDSTNVIESSVLSVITGISLDHTAFLGDTKEKIAAEKAGIIKPSVPVLFGGTDKGALEVIKAAAEEKGAKLYTTDYEALEISSSSLDGSVFSYKNIKYVKLPLLGLYQPRNASSVLEAIGILRENSYNIPDEAIYQGMLSARWPARFEIISKEPLIIFDGAHNPEGIESAVKSVKHYFGDTKLVAISGLLADKDYLTEAKMLSEIISVAYTVTPNSDRALGADSYAGVLSDVGIEAYAKKTVGDALRAAIDTALNLKKAIIILGSLYTYVDFIAALKELNQGDM